MHKGCTAARRAYRSQALPSRLLLTAGHDGQGLNLSAGSASEPGSVFVLGAVYRPGTKDNLHLERLAVALPRGSSSAGPTSWLGLVALGVLFALGAASFRRSLRSRLG